MAGGSERAVITAFFANLGIAVAKFVGFGVTGSASLLAEGVHSLADTSNQALLLLGGRRARKPPTPTHPFGYGRERYFWSFVVALVLFAGGGVFALYEGQEKLRHPHEVESIGWAVGILVFAILIECFALRTAIVESAKVKGDQSWPSFIRHSRIPELPVVLLEDIGALFGLVFALGGVAVAEITGDPRYDAVGSLAIGALLTVIAVVLAVEMKSLLIGEAATTDELAEVAAAVEQTPGVHRVVHLHTTHLGPEQLLVVAKIAVDGTAPTGETAAIIDRAEAAVRAKVPTAGLVYLEPVVAVAP